MSEDTGNLKIYADKECTKPISEIGWDNTFYSKLADGTEFRLPNSAQRGEKATATIYIKNDGAFDFGIRAITFFDSRINVNLSNVWIYARGIISVTLSFDIPKNSTAHDIIKAGKLYIEGFYVLK